MFTRVTACTLAGSPTKNRYIKGFSYFVTPITAPIASGWSDIAGWAPHPEDNAVRVIDVFVIELRLSGLGFKDVRSDMERPAYHPWTMLKIYIDGYLNQLQSSRRLDRKAQRSVELMWLTSRLTPDFKTIADFRKDNGEAIRAV